MKNASASSRNKLPPLPQELWARILTHLDSPSQIATIAEVSPHWHQEITSSSFQPTWRKIYFRTTPHFPPPWALLPAGWRHQVAASYHLERLFSSLQSSNARQLFLPPRYDSLGNPHPADALRLPSRFDLEDTLGRATAVQAFATCILIAFEKGLALLFRPLPNSVKPPRLYVDHSRLLHNIQLLSSTPAPDGTVLAATPYALVCIRTQPAARNPIHWRVLDSFSNDTAVITDLTVAPDAQVALIAFCNGVIRVVNLHGGFRFSVSLGETAERVVASAKWLVASSSFPPVAVGVWNIADGTCSFSFSQTSPGWKDILSIAGLTTTNSQDHFAIWNGKDAVRILNARTGEFSRVIDVHPRFSRISRTATEEAEHGAGSAHVGRGKMVLFSDQNTAVIATSNRVLVVPLYGHFGKAPPIRQLDGARRALLALSTDNRIVVAAESDAFGGLGFRVSGRTAIASPPRLQIWNVASEQLRSELILPSPATSLSVCADVVAVVCSAVGQVMVVFGSV